MIAARPSPVLSVEGLTARYGQAEVLFGIDLELGAGEVLALVGRNGAGKSTTLKAIMGLVARSARRAEQRFQIGFQCAVRGNGDWFARLLAHQVANPCRQRIECRPLLRLMSGRRLPRIGGTGRIGHRRTGGTNRLLRTSRSRNRHQGNQDQSNADWSSSSHEIVTCGKIAVD